jgi:hypothetical protein
LLEHPTYQARRNFDTDAERPARPVRISAFRSAT